MSGAVGSKPTLIVSGLPRAELRLQIVAFDEIDRPLAEEVELFVESHGRRIVRE